MSLYPEIYPILSSKAFSFSSNIEFSNPLTVYFFIQGEREGLAFTFMCICQLSSFPSTIIEDDDVFLPLYIFTIFLLNQVTIDVWVLNSIKQVKLLFREYLIFM